MAAGPYGPIVMEHFTNPRNVGEIENADGVGRVGSPVCGDVLKMTIKVENGQIVDVKFKTFGCCAAIASSSMATEMIKGKTIEEALKLTDHKVVEALGGLPEAKVHCSVLAEQALRRAVDDYLKKATGRGLAAEQIDADYRELPSIGEGDDPAQPSSSAA